MLTKGAALTVMCQRGVLEGYVLVKDWPRYQRGSQQELEGGSS